MIYALAPDGTSARKANDVLNQFVSDRRRGVVIFHDHFTGKPHGGVVVVDVSDEESYALLDDSGPLEGWDVRTHPLTFSLAATGFAAQMEFTAQHYAGKSLEELRRDEVEDARFWWQAQS